MHDGWYRIRKPGVHGKISVEFVYQNYSDSGSVTRLVKEGCTYEQVLVLTPQEFLNSLEAEQKNTILAVKAGLL